MSVTEARILHPPETELPAVRKVTSCGEDLNGLNGGARFRRRHRRRVKFADEMGLDLAQVRVMPEPSWVPPQLPTRILADLQPILPGADPACEDQLGGGHTKCKFKRRFEQPIARYIVFRENIEKHCICLNSLHFDGCTVKGVVSVKNICFNKRVFAKVTHNGWLSSEEVAASYCNSSDGCVQDNFTFSHHCPAMTGFEFCLGFEALDLGRQTFWDNNGGENYKVAVERSGGRKCPTPSAEFTGLFRPSFAHVTEFSEYAAWQHHSSDKVYY